MYVCVQSFSVLHYLSNPMLDLLFSIIFLVTIFTGQINDQLDMLDSSLKLFADASRYFVLLMTEIYQKLPWILCLSAYLNKGRRKCMVLSSGSKGSVWHKHLAWCFEKVSICLKLRTNWSQRYFKRIQTFQKSRKSYENWIYNSHDSIW